MSGAVVQPQAAEAVTAALGAIDGLRVREHEVLAPYTTYKIGGPARWLLEIDLRAAVSPALAVLAQYGVRWHILGNGSNVLVADRGLDGAIVHLAAGGELDRVALVRDARGPGLHRLEAGAGVSVTRLLRTAKDEQLGGLWVLGGVPGTVGGAVRMNAGTRWGDLGSVLEAAEVADAAGARWWPASELGLAYRHAALPAGSVVTSARFAVGDADEATRGKLDEVLAHRRATQPLQVPSCGSVFANPPGDAAGRLIEAAGLKGTIIGGAQISTQHANWITNLGGASAADVRALMDAATRAVEVQFGVTLRAEVQLLGDWDADATPAAGGAR
jgi:UDP-N-acetylmuramate dehydrogenase